MPSKISVHVSDRQHKFVNLNNTLLIKWIALSLFVRRFAMRDTSHTPVSLTRGRYQHKHVSDLRGPDVFSAFPILCGNDISLPLADKSTVHKWPISVRGYGPSVKASGSGSFSLTHKSWNRGIKQSSDLWQGPPCHWLEQKNCLHR